MNGLKGRQELTNRSKKNYIYRCLHYHVFDKNLIYKMLDYTNFNIISFVEQDNDYVVLGKKFI